MQKAAVCRLHYVNTNTAFGDSSVWFFFNQIAVNRPNRASGLDFKLRYLLLLSNDKPIWSNVRVCLQIQISCKIGVNRIPMAFGNTYDVAAYVNSNMSRHILCTRQSYSVVNWRTSCVHNDCSKNGKIINLHYHNISIMFVILSSSV